MHDSDEWRLEHHGDARADGNHDHYPVQIRDQAQEVTVESIHARFTQNTFKALVSQQ